MNYTKVINELKKLGSKEKAKVLQRFFKTGKGEYGEGDVFWGVTVPQTRKIVKKYRELSPTEVEKLLKHKVHEVRLCGALILVEQYKKHPEKTYKIYMKNKQYVNNWDLIDLSADRIVGAYLADKPKDILEKLAKSKSFWDRRIAMMATFHYIKQGDATEALKTAEILVNDKHDLIQKAVGWMLREVGKRCSRKIEEEFLDKRAAHMPRMMLRYAIEHFEKKKRQFYLQFASKT